MYAPAANQTGGLPPYAQVPGTQVAIPLPTQEQVLTYSTSWWQFYELVRRCKVLINTQVFVQMLEVRHPDQAVERFEQWTVLKLGVYVLVKSLALFVGFFTTPGFAILHLPFASIGAVFAVAFTHLNWFCVVKRQGCCGRHGYLAWAVWLAMEPLMLWGIFGRFYGGCFMLLLYLPNLFMAAACLTLFRAPPETQLRSFAGQASEAFSNVRNTTRAATEPCCPWLWRSQGVQPNGGQE